MYPQTFHTTISIPILLTSLADADIVTTVTPGFVGWIKKFSYYTGTVCSTPGDGSTLNLEIGTTDLTGGSLVLDSDLLITLGEITSATAITGNNMFDANDTISIEGTSTTAFAEGSGSLLIEIEGPVLR